MLHRCSRKMYVHARRENFCTRVSGYQSDKPQIKYNQKSKTKTNDDAADDGSDISLRHR